MVSLLFGFSGRVGRLEYFLLSCALAVFAVLLVVVIMTGLAPHGAAASSRAMAWPAIVAVLAVAPIFVWFSLALQAKRFRDMGWNPVVAIPGWFGLLVVDKTIGTVFPSLTVGESHSTLFGIFLNLGLTLCLLLWPSAPGGAGAVFDPRIFDENWSDSAAKAPRMPEPAPEPATTPSPAQARAAAPRGFGRRGL
jgi:uncharacterized membrane protein YhaH (DUF805 family)